MGADFPDSCLEVVFVGIADFSAASLNPADALTQVSHICTADTVLDERSASIVAVMVIVLMVVVVVVMSEIPAG
jgi:hypothetical protein